MARRQPKTVLDHCIASRGVHRGALTAAWVAQWARCAQELGRFPTTAQYADYWAIHERTGWRHREAIVDVFGEEFEPTVMYVAAAIADRLGQSHSPRAVMDLALA